MREREEIMRARFDRDRDGIMRTRPGAGVETEDEGSPDDVIRRHVHHHSMDELHRAHKDISARHQELIDHRQKVSPPPPPPSPSPV
jgi:hypothetical protein